MWSVTLFVEYGSFMEGGVFGSSQSCKAESTVTVERKLRTQEGE